MTKQESKLRKGFTSQIVRDINATVKMGRNVRFLRPSVRMRVIQARLQYGKLQVKCFDSGRWFDVHETDVIKGA